MTEQQSRFDAATIDIFNDELGALVQKYLNMKNVDPLALYGPLWRRAEEVKVIGCNERRRQSGAEQ